MHNWWKFHSFCKVEGWILCYFPRRTGLCNISHIKIFTTILIWFFFIFLWSSYFDKDFGFVNRLFVIRLRYELGPCWTIFDNKDNVHHVTFNMDIYNPRITEGWSDLRNFYHLQPPKLCYLRHTVNSAFEIYLYEHCSKSNVQKFLSHVRTNAPLTRSKLIHFEFRLSKTNCKTSFLVRFLTFYPIFFFLISWPYLLFSLLLFSINTLFWFHIIFSYFVLQDLNSDLCKYFRNS